MYFFGDIVKFIRSYWQKRKYFFFPGYTFICPRLNQSLKWRFDYITLVKRNKPGTKKWIKFFETLELNIQREFYRYHVKASQVKGSFYVLIRKPRGKVLGETFKNMADDVKYISGKVYKKVSEQSSRFRYKYFPYFKLVRWYGGYQYHFLVVKQDFQYEYS